MKLENTKNTFYLELDKEDVAQYRYIYLALWKERAELGPKIHIESAIKFLINKGYEVVKNG